MFSGADIKKHVHKQPFVPFRLMTSAGEAFDILHPELVMVGTRDVTIGLPSPQDPSVYDDQVWIALIHIASIKAIAKSPTTSGGNGQATAPQ